MLAQLKTVVLIKEAIKLAFFILVEYLEHLWVLITGSKWPETNNFPADPGKLSLTRKERVGGPGAQLSKTTSTLECLV